MERRCWWSISDKMFQKQLDIRLELRVESESKMEIQQPPAGHTHLDVWNLDAPETVAFSRLFLAVLPGTVSRGGRQSRWWSTVTALCPHPGCLLQPPSLKVEGLIWEHSCCSFSIMLSHFWAERRNGWTLLEIPFSFGAQKIAYLYSFPVVDITNYSHGSGSQKSSISIFGLKSRCEQVCTPSGCSGRQSVPYLSPLLAAADVPWLVATSLQTLSLRSYCLFSCLW